MSIHICTAVTRNYLGFAGVLAESLRRHNPEVHLDVLIVDGDAAAITAPLPAGIEPLYPSDLAIDRSEFLRLATMYGPFEISNALKPTLMRTLLERGADHVLWTDADVLALGDLTDIPTAIEQAGVLVTPHHLGPVPRVAHRTDYERVALTAGTYNAGVVGAAGSRGLEMLAWWESRVARDCIHDPAKGLFVDQRWLDLVPGMFGAHVLRDAGVNFGWWRAASSNVSRGSQGPVVDGVPLRLFHLSGFDPKTPWLLSRHVGTAPIALLSSMPALARVIDEYCDALEHHNVAEWQRLAYGYDSFGRDSTPLDTRMRSLYREALIAHERGDLDKEPPSPFSHDRGDTFLRWLRRSDVLWAGDPPAGRHLLGLWAEQEELQTEFPDPRGNDAAAFSVWAARTGRIKEGVPYEVLPRREDDASAIDRDHGVLVLSLASRHPTSGVLAEQLIAALAHDERAVEAIVLAPDDPPALPIEGFQVAIIVGTPADLRQLYHLLGHFGRLGLTVVAVLDWPSAVPPGVLTGMERVAALASPDARLTRALAEEGIQVADLNVAITALGGVRHYAGMRPRRVRFGACVDCELAEEAAAGLDALTAYLRAVPAVGAAQFTLVGANADRSPLALEHARALAGTRGDVRILEEAPPRALDRALAESDAFLSVGAPEGVDVAAFTALASGLPTVLSGTGPNLARLGSAGALVISPTGQADRDERIRQVAAQVELVLNEPAVWAQAPLAAQALQSGRSVSTLAAALRATLDGVVESHAEVVSVD